ncbi:PilZ domain-containing protein [Alteromonas sediminis]|uniref:PilZ domain-containing protein n=1 Tax=Alteromonas sediminis TaxID=2259342 RepID=A0A3N5YM98_9ALTE|nr:PilZ domain-containing protein [Alteromonas sediminis]RPJ66441.1 PilZ domain-containing protein [Alteromonas sediminis]
MSTNSEADIIKQYKKLIDALIPYQQENKLLEGLNKFSSRLPAKVRNIIRDEVIRLTSLTDASADNSAFASFPIKKFKHFGISMRLDKVGRQILEQETAKYFDRYTVGVFESVMSSEHYQSHIKQEQQKKIVSAFTVQAQSFDDIDFGSDLAISPNFSVTSSHFEKNKACILSSLSGRRMKVQSKRMPHEAPEDDLFTFVFPEVKGLCSAGTILKFRKVGSEFNQVSNRFETEFEIAPQTDKKLVQRVETFVARSVNQFPLERELEVERVLQDLDRDHIFAHSPWIPAFLTCKNGVYQVSKALMTKVNFEFNHGFETLSHFPNTKSLTRIMRELKKFGETFLLKGTFNTKKGDVTVCATHRELVANKLLAPFIKMVMASNEYTVLQFRLCEISAEHREAAFSIHDIQSRDYPTLGVLSHILFCKDITQWVGKLKVPDSTQMKAFPSAIIDQERLDPIAIVMEPELDRRAEPRYIMNKQASVKSGFFKAHSAVLQDLSISGLKLKLEGENMAKLDQQIRVSVPELKLRNQKYDVVHFDTSTQVVRLKVPTNVQSGIHGLMRSNSGYFKQRDIANQQKNIHRFLWELSIRNLPCACVLITQHRQLFSRLRTVYIDNKCTDLYPFEQTNHQVLLHGFLADKDATKPKSEILYRMLSQAEQDAQVIHAMRKKDRQIIFVPEQNFLFGKVRHQIAGFVLKGEVEACVTQLNAIKCQSETTPLTAKRLAQISKIDMEAYEKLKTVPTVYTHVLTMSNVSPFHQSLLKSGISPEKPS